MSACVYVCVCMCVHKMCKETMITVQKMCMLTWGVALLNLPDKAPQ